jgi:hypothetical protein
LTKFDDGACDILKFSPSHIIINFHGKKIKGTYHILSTGVASRKFNENSFMLFKGKELTEAIDGTKSSVDVTKHKILSELLKILNRG